MLANLLKTQRHRCDGQGRNMQMKLVGAAFSSVAVALILSMAAPVSAATITPTGYSFDQATDCGTWCYSDSGNELTDGVLGYAGWAVNDGAQWDGWTDALVNIDFAFGGPKTFNSVSVGSTQDNPRDVVLPNLRIYSSLDGSLWTSRGGLLTLPSNSNDNSAYSRDAHVFLTVSGLNFTAPYVRVQLVSNCCFMFTDEIRFSSAAGVPEPATWGLMVLGFGSLGVVLRRRRGRLALAA